MLKSSFDSSQITFAQSDLWPSNPNGVTILFVCKDSMLGSPLEESFPHAQELDSRQTLIDSVSETIEEQEFSEYLTTSVTNDLSQHKKAFSEEFPDLRTEALWAAKTVNSFVSSVTTTADISTYKIEISDAKHLNKITMASVHYQAAPGSENLKKDIKGISDLIDQKHAQNFEQGLSDFKIATIKHSGNSKAPYLCEYIPEFSVFMVPSRELLKKSIELGVPTYLAFQDLIDLDTDRLDNSKRPHHIKDTIIESLFDFSMEDFGDYIQKINKAHQFMGEAALTLSNLVLKSDQEEHGGQIPLFQESSSEHQPS